jgi:integral membrane sensor domain MASE1
MRAKAVIFSLLVVSGFILSTLGLISFPVFHNINYFWPAAVVQAVGAVLFGWTGVIAGTVFPMLSNMVTDKSLVSVVLFTPANFAQSLLPYLLYNRYSGGKLEISTFRDGVRFSVLAGIIPQFCGGLLASGLLAATGRLQSGLEFLKMLALWLIDSVPWIIGVGVPIMIIFVPILREYGYLFNQQPSPAAERGSDA